MTLYEIDQAIYELLNRGFTVDEETGEIIDGAEELEQLQLERSQKLGERPVCLSHQNACLEQSKQW